MKNRRLKSLLSLIITVSVMFSVLPAAFAEEDDASPYDEYFYGEEYAYTLNGMTWNALMSDFMAAYKIKDWQLGFGYYNTVTGETHFYNGDTYFISASMYKLPLCMYFNDKVNNGELGADDKYRGIKLSELFRGTIEVSSNAYAHILLSEFNGDKTFTHEIAKYMGVDLETEAQDSAYFKKGNFNFTPRQYISCLKTLWDNQNSYQMVIEHMLKASPTRNFLSHEQSYTVAHKYGYLEDSGYLYVNDCGICYTDDPICIVMFTKGIPNTSSTVLAEYCSLMCSYAQASGEQRLEQEAAKKAAAAQAEEDARLAREAEEEMAKQEEDSQQVSEQSDVDGQDTEVQTSDSTNAESRLSVLTALSVVMISCVAAALIAHFRKKISSNY